MGAERKASSIPKSWLQPRPCSQLGLRGRHSPGQGAKAVATPSCTHWGWESGEGWRRLLQKALGITHPCCCRTWDGGSSPWGPSEHEGRQLLHTEGHGASDSYLRQSHARTWTVQGGRARLGSKGEQLFLHWPGRISCSLSGHLALITAGQV